MKFRELAKEGEDTKFVVTCENVVELQLMTEVMRKLGARKE